MDTNLKPTGPELNSNFVSIHPWMAAKEKEGKISVHAARMSSSQSGASSAALPC
jgi:hypothetical protein